MKKSNIFFAIYSAVIVLGIILFLIFYPKFATRNDFATSISLICPREITFELGDEIILPENYISVEPTDMIEQLEIEVYTKSSKTDPDDIFLDNNAITSNSTGFYYIKFIVPGKKYDLYDTLVVHVVKKGELNYINQKLHIIQNNKEYSTNEIYDINIDNSYSIYYNNNDVIFEDNKLITISPTTFSMRFTFDFEFYKYTTSIDIVSANTLVPDPIDPPVITPPEDPIEPEIPVEPEEPSKPEDPTDPEEPTDPESPEDTIEPEIPTDPEDPIIPEENGYTISIINYDSENITFTIDGTKTLFKLHYEVRYNNELCLYQSVTAQSSDPTMCNVTSDSLYIYIEYLNTKGTFTLTISYGNLTTKTLTITFE